jgi:hypothetical protein
MQNVYLSSEQIDEHLCNFEGSISFIIKSNHIKARSLQREIKNTFGYLSYGVYKFEKCYFDTNLVVQ